MSTYIILVKAVIVEALEEELWLMDCRKHYIFLGRLLDFCKMGIFMFCIGTPDALTSLFTCIVCFPVYGTADMLNFQSFYYNLFWTEHVSKFSKH